MALWKQRQHLITAATNDNHWAPWTPHLQLPDAGALHCGLLHSAIHEGNEHVQQQDVGEYDVADEEHVEDLLVLVVLGELHVAHANGELEELQGGVRDVFVGELLDVLFRVCRIIHSTLWNDVSDRRIGEQGDHRCDTQRIG